MKHAHTRACVCEAVEVSEQDLQAVLKALAAQWSRTAFAHHLLSYSLPPHTGEERDRARRALHTVTRDTHARASRRTSPHSRAGHNRQRRGKQ